MFLACLIVLGLLGSGLTQNYPRQRILQEQSCYYEGFKKQLTCQCDVNLSKAFLLLRLAFNVREIGQEVRSVWIESCPDLLLSLDLQGVDPTNIPFNIRNSGVVTVDVVDMDPKEEGTPKDSQLLAFNVNNVETMHFKAVNVTEAFKILALNVKKLLMTDCQIAALHSPGVKVSYTNKLEIRNSVFKHVYPSSIVVEGVKEVFVVNNQFNINVIKVVSAKDGKRLHISCNRLIGEPLSPECVERTNPSTPSNFHNLYYSARETVGTTTVGTTTTEVAPDSSLAGSTSTPPADILLANGLSDEILIGIAAGVGFILLLLLILITWLCCRNRKEDEIVDDKESTDTNENLNRINEVSRDVTAELDKLLEGEENENHCDPIHNQGGSPEDTRAKFSSPAWINEIHNNKIFAKQRSINSPDHSKESQPLNLAEQAQTLNVHRRKHVRIPVRSISEILEFEDDDGNDKGPLNT